MTQRAKGEQSSMDIVGKYCIVRSANAGVFAGTVVSRDGDAVSITDARRIWYWDGAATLSELATRGTAKPGNCKFPAPVPYVLVLGVCEIIPTTAAAQASIESVSAWSEHDE